MPPPISAEALFPYLRWKETLIRVGVVGCGRIAEHHLPFISSTPGTEIVGLADVDHSRACCLAAKYKVGKAYASLEQMLQDVKPDVLHILTPPQQHLSNAESAISRGIHVLVEKPMVLSSEAASRILALAEEKQVCVCADYNMLYHSSMQKIVRLVKSGRFGSLVHVEVFMGFDYGLAELRESPELPWSFDLPGGILHNYISHPLYLALYWLGKPRRISVTPRSFGVLPHQLTDHLEITLEAEKISANVTVSLVSLPRVFYVKLYCEKGTLFANFDTFTLVVTRERRLPRLVNRGLQNLDEARQLLLGTCRLLAGVATGRIVPYQGLRTLIRRYYAAIQENLPMPVSRDLIMWTTAAEETVAAGSGKVRINTGCGSASRDARKKALTVLVTGASGFVGRRLVQRLSQEDYAVRAFVRVWSETKALEAAGAEIVYGDVRSYESFLRAAKSADAVVHLAAAFRGTRKFIYETCVKGTENLARVARECQIHTVVYVSSMSVYDYLSSPDRGVISEDSPLETHPEWRGTSSQAKIEAERIALSHIADKGPSWTILRPSLIFGDGWNFLSPAGVRLGSVLFVLGGRQKPLRLVHIDDVCEAIIRVLRNDGTRGMVLTISHPEAITVREYVDRYIRRTNNNLHVAYVPYWLAFGGIFFVEMLYRLAGGVPPLNRRRLAYLFKGVYVDPGTLRRLTGWEPGDSLMAQLTRATHAFAGSERRL